jgi:hypothetical protein
MTPSTRRRRRWLFRAVLAAVAWVLAQPAAAQTVTSANANTVVQTRRYSPLEL